MSGRIGEGCGLLWLDPELRGGDGRRWNNSGKVHWHQIAGALKDLLMCLGFICIYRATEGSEAPWCQFRGHLVGKEMSGRRMLRK